MRIALTGFSIGWGIFILIVLLSSGRGLVNGMHHNFKAFNIGVVTVHKRDGSFCVLFALIVDNLRVIHNFILNDYPLSYHQYSGIASWQFAGKLVSLHCHL